SPSQAESYQACPRQYALARRLDAGGEAGPYASFGRLIHDILDETEQDAVQTGASHGSIDHALECLDRRLDSFDFGPKARKEAWRKRAERLLRGLYEEWIRPGARPVLLEHPLEATIDGIPWRGRADRVELIENDQVRIVDYKTTTSPKSAAESATSIQLGFYLLASRLDEAIASIGEATEAEFWYPLAKRKQKWVSFDPERLDEVIETMTDISRRIAAEDWGPVVSAACDRCPVRTVCPEWPEGRESFAR
ncbi:MAG: PD-(D/E)XK nuclease family protein, partial [Acidimicrobiia bacterium]|nr:PD-(D/E)XK nuclease family protein [Acidimicrobiia bacterium]